MPATFPSKILSSILEYVIGSDIPSDQSKLMNEPPPNPRRYRVESPGAPDWMIVTSLSNGFHFLGKRAYCAQRPSIISPSLLDQLHKIRNQTSVIEEADDNNLNLLFKYAQQSSRHYQAAVPPAHPSLYLVIKPTLPISGYWLSGRGYDRRKYIHARK
ncbi:MAG: hypothetical protein Q9198_002294 [Flavoplaca austrocitrina]